MKTVDIITSEMHQIHGANRVTEKLLLGNSIFRDHGLFLRFIVTQDEIMDCQNLPNTLLGKDINTSVYKNKRRIIETLKSLDIYNSYPIQKGILHRVINKNAQILKHYETIIEKPDIVIFQDPFAAYFVIKEYPNEYSSILISHAANDPLEQLLMNRPAIKGTKEELYVRDILRYVYDHVTKVVTICNESKQYMKRTYNIDCPCIINGIEDVEITNSSKYSAEDNKCHIIILASVQYRKGQDIAVNALSKLTPKFRERIKLHIVGGGQGYNEIKELVSRLDLQEIVEMHGPVLDVEKLLPCMDVFLLPSRADTVPIAIIEAMRAGLPVFATDVGEVANMLDGCGKVIQANEDSIMKMYSDILSGIYNLRQMGIDARKKFLENYNLNSMISRYCDVLESL